MKGDLGLKNKIIPIILSSIVFFLAIINKIYLKVGNEGTDSTFILLITLAVLIIILPWENITSFKAAGVELTLNQPQVKGAINSLKIDYRGKKLLEKKLSELASEIEQIKGSRVLWVDDKPQEILGERRLFRALGIEVVTAKDSESAQRKIDEDNDFDLIISDVQRIGFGIRKEMALVLFELMQDYKKYLKDGTIDYKLREVFEKEHFSLNDTAEISKKDEKYWIIENEIDDGTQAYIMEDIGTQIKVYEGTILDGFHFILNLRTSEDSIIKNIPIILYTAYTDDVLKENIKNIKMEEQLSDVGFSKSIDTRLVDLFSDGDDLFEKDIKFSKSIDTLLELVVIGLSDVRSNTIKVSPHKKPTPPS